MSVECTERIIHTSNGPVASASVDFDEDGDPDGSNTITFDTVVDGGGPLTCTVTETEDGDAEDVSYECEGQFPLTQSNGFTTQRMDQVSDPCGGVHGPQEKPITVYIGFPEQYATVTVTNEFPEKPDDPTPAAQPVVVEPTFTG